MNNKTNKNIVGKSTLKTTKGITLVALVITIIVLIILAGVSISAVMNGGLIQNAKGAKEMWDNSVNDELGKLSMLTTLFEEEKPDTVLSDWEYYLYGTNIVLTKYVGTSTDVVVPATYYVPQTDKYYSNNQAGTYNVTLSAWSENSSNQLQYLFQGNTNITSVQFKEGVKWGYKDIRGEWSENAVLNWMFIDCTALKSVSIPSSLSNNFVWGAFSGCTSLERIKFATVPQVELTGDNPSNVLGLKSAFDASPAFSKPVPSGPITILVSNTSELAGTTIEAGEATYGTFSCAYPKLVFVGYEKEKTVPALSDWEYYLYETNIVLTKYVGTATDIVVPATYYVPQTDKYYSNNQAGTYNVTLQGFNDYGAVRLFANNTSITSVEFKEGVRWGSLEFEGTTYWSEYSDFQWMFENCTNLESVSIPSSLHTDTMFGAFKGCTNLKEIKFATAPQVEITGSIIQVPNGLKAAFVYYPNSTTSCATTGPVTVKVPSSSALPGTSIDAGSVTLADDMIYAYPKLVFVGY